MIRINLLPVREVQKIRSGKQIIVFFALLLAVEVAGLFYYQSTQEDIAADLRRRNDEIQTKIKRLKEKTSAVAALKAEKAALEQQKNVLDGLIEGQSGPVKMLDEIATMLTPLQGAEAKLSAEAKGWNPDWDPRRLWIDSFREVERVVRITGHARNNEDLAQFLQRLTLSRHFVQTELKVSESTEITELGPVKFVRFNIEGLAIYGPADVVRLASGELGAKKKKR